MASCLLALPACASPVCAETRGNPRMTLSNPCSSSRPREPETPTREKGIPKFRSSPKKWSLSRRKSQQVNVQSPKSTLGIIVVPHMGVPRKRICGRASGATVGSGHVLSFFLCSTRETRHCDMYPNRFGYVSDMYPCACVALGKRFSRGSPLAVPPLR